jgi:hypothetical protein
MLEVQSAPMRGVRVAVPRRDQLLSPVVQVPAPEGVQHFLASKNPRGEATTSRLLRTRRERPCRRTAQ